MPKKKTVKSTDRQLSSVKHIISFLNTLSLQLFYFSSSASVQPVHPPAQLLSAGVSGGERRGFLSVLLSDLRVRKALDR